jgi:preprotein translocase subunit SecY
MRFLLRLLITLGIPAVLALLGEHLLLPGMPAEVVEQTGGSHANVSVLALGITPILSAYWMVEVIAFLVPRWSRLRHGNPSGRTKLEGAARLLALVLASLQAFGMAISLQAIAKDVPSGVGTSEFSVSIPVVMLTLVGGVCLQVVLAQIITRHGFLNGFVTIFGAGVARDLAQSMTKAADLPEARDVALAVVAALVLAVACWAALRGSGEVPASPASAGQPEVPYRDARRLVVHPWIPIPSSSFQAFGFASSLLMLPMGLANLHVAPFKQLDEFSTGSTFLPCLILVTGITMFVFARLMHRPAEMADLASRLGATGNDALKAEARSALRATFLPSFLFFLAVILAAQRSRMDAVSVVLIVAVLMDLAHALRNERNHPDLVSVWDERRASAVPALRAALAADGISSETRGMAFLSLWQVFAPYAPAQLLVPREDVDRAVRTLHHLLLGEEAPDNADRAPTTVPEPKGLWSPSRRTGVLGACAAIAGLTWAMTSVLPHEVARTAGPRPKLEILKVDDTIDPFTDTSEDSIPEGTGIGIYLERVPAGSGRYAQVHFARIVPRPGEAKTAAAARLRSWLSTIALPPGARFGLEDVLDYDEDTRKATLVELRTFVLAGEPVLRTEDVVDATVVDSPTVDGDPDVAVSVVFSPGAARRFEDFTRQWTMHRAAIVIDDEIKSAPIIKSAISGGRIMLSPGQGDLAKKKAEAKRLARGLKGR